MTQSLIVPAPVVNEELISLANEANQHIGAGDALYRTAIVHYAKAGQVLIKAQERCKEDFEFYRNQYIRVGRSQAYNYMRLAREMPQLLEESVQLTGLPNLSQAIALLSAPEEVKEAVMQRIEDGEDVKIKEIEHLKKENKRIADEAAKQNRLKEEAEKKFRQLDLKFVEAVDSTVNAKVQAEKAKLQANVDRIAADLSADYQAKIDSQTDKISELRNQLAQAQRSPASAEQEQLKELQEKIADAELALEQTQAKHQAAKRNEALAQAASHLILQISEVSATFIENPITADELINSTRDLLDRAQHDLNALGEMIADITRLDFVE